MEFSWIAFWVTVAFYLAQAVLSFKEGTFSRGQLSRRGLVGYHGRYLWQHLPMSFLNNWSISIGDLVLFPMINALVIPYLFKGYSGLWYLSVLECAFYLFAGSVITLIFYYLWWKHDENLGHVFIRWGNSVNGDITKAGWVHFWFMTLQSAVVLACILTPMPGVVVFWTSGLLSMFFIIQNIQGVLIQEGFWPKHFFIAAVELATVWAMAIVKMT